MTWTIRWRLAVLLGSLLLLPILGHTWEEPRSVRLSASQGTVDSPLLAERVVTFYRLDIDGPLTIPAPVGTFAHGRRILFLLRSQVPQPLLFAPEGYGPQKPEYPPPVCTTGGESDFLVFRYDGPAQRWLYRPPSIAPTGPPVECGY